MVGMFIDGIVLISAEVDEFPMELAVPYRDVVDADDAEGWYSSR